MDINEMMKYISYALMAIGVMAFFVSVITEVIKSWPGLGKLPTSCVVIVLSMALCPAAFLALMRWRRQTVEWHMMFACVVAAFIVALVAMDGWERVKDIWDRAPYRKDRRENRKNA